MSLAIWVLLSLFGLPALAAGAVWTRLRLKERKLAGFLRAAQEDLRASGAELRDKGRFTWQGRGGSIEASTNPLFGEGFSLRVAVWSDTIHEFELTRRRPVPPEFGAFKPLLARWDSAGKMFIDCYAAGVTRDPAISSDVRRLIELSGLPLAKAWRGGTFTYREGFEPKVPQWHWRHDQRPRLPGGVRRYCFSYWQEGPLLNPGIMKVLWELAGGKRSFFITDREDLSFVEWGFGVPGLPRQGSLVELPKPEMAVAADLATDGEFFHGLLVAPVPPATLGKGVPRYRFHDAALEAFPDCDFYARRLYDDECSWFSGEYEIVSSSPRDVRGVLDRVAAELGAQVMDIDRRFHKRIVVPLNF